MSTTTPGPRAGSGRAAVPGPGQARAGRMTGRAAVPVSPPPTPPGRGRSAGDRPPGGGPPPALVGRRKRRWRRILVASALSVLLVAGLGAGALWFYLRSLDDNMGRVEAFAPTDAERPAAVAGGQNILVLGSDSRDPDADPNAGYRADTIMLMHIPSGQDQVYLISIPRDLWVFVPPNAEGTDGGYEAKINAATAIGGVPLAVQTVENYTGVRIDHVMLLDFAGFVEVTDALDGVTMHIDQTITSIHKPHRTFEQGDQQLGGKEALDYIRQRKQFPEGDFARMRNQQQFLRALMDKAASTGTLTNPGKLNAFLQTATRTLTVDEEFSLVDVAWQLRGLRSDNLTFLTSPHAGTGTAGGQSVVLSDDEPAAQLYTAVREDRVAKWAANHPDQLKG